MIEVYCRILKPMRGEKQTEEIFVPIFWRKKNYQIIFLIAWMIHEQQQENGNPEKIKMSNTWS